MTPDEQAGVKQNLTSLKEVGEAIGSWTVNLTVRQTGISYHAKFNNRVDVDTAYRFAEQLSNSPGMLVTALERLLEVDGPGEVL